MSLAEKLRRQLQVRQGNVGKLDTACQAQGAVDVPFESSASIEPDSETSQNSLASRLTRLREVEEKKRRQASPSQFLGDLQLDLNGQIRNSSAGSFFYVTRQCDTLPSGRAGNSPLEKGARGGAYDLKTDGNLVCPLVRLLTKKDVSCGPDRIAFLDTETTGLSGGTGTYAFLVGLGSWGDSGFSVEQYFMRDFHEERALLIELQERLARVQVLVTFNGKSFDLPLLESRFVLARLSWPLSQVPHLDLLHPARRLWKLRLGDCSLTNLESRLLAMERETDVPGNLIPQLYFNYTRTKNPKGLKEIFEHNRQDIETLAALTDLVGETLLGVQAHNDLGGEELFSLGRYFQDLGQRELSLEIGQAALQRDLSKGLKVRVMQQLAGLLKSQQRYSQAAALWKEMIASSPVFVPEAWENLAIYYEHRERNLLEALALTEQALRKAGGEEAGPRAASLEGWHRRRDRLLRKMKKQVSPQE